MQTQEFCPISTSPAQCFSTYSYLYSLQLTKARIRRCMNFRLSVFNFDIFFLISMISNDFVLVSVFTNNQSKRYCRFTLYYFTFHFHQLSFYCTDSRIQLLYIDISTVSQANSETLAITISFHSPVAASGR